MPKDAEKDRAARAVMALVGSTVPLSCIGEAFAIWPCTVDQLAEEARRLAREEKTAAASEKRRVRQGVTATGELPEPQRSLHETAKRDVAKRGRKSKVRTGTARLRFGDVVVHTDTMTTAGGGLVKVDTTSGYPEPGMPVTPPVDWADAAVRAITAAKLAGFTERELETGQPAMTGAFVLQKGPDGVVSIAPQKTGPYDSALERIRRAGFASPPWFDERLFAVLVRVASFASGSRGQLSAARLTELLRAPAKLRRHLQERVGNSKEARSVAMSVPRGSRKTNRA